MKGLVFRLIAVILILVAVFSSIYKDALSFRKKTFSPASGDVFYDSMVFTDLTAFTTKDAEEHLVVGGTVYPDNNRNAKKNVFFKLYNSTGALIATSGISEEEHTLLLNSIETTPDGFALVCEARGETESYGKVYHYSPDGKFIKSVVIDYSDKVPQMSGTEYGISIVGSSVYYTGIDSQRVVCADTEGKYLVSIDNKDNTTICDVAVTDDIIYTIGSAYDKYNIPKAYMYAFSMDSASLLWTKNELVTNAPTDDAIYSQADKIEIITNNGLPVSIVLVGKYFDTGAYKKYITNNKLETEEDVDTIAKKSLRNDFYLYRTGHTKADYVKSPYSSAFFISADITGEITKTNMYETNSSKSVSSVSISKSVAKETEKFVASIISVDAVRSESELFKTSITSIDSNLKEIHSTVVAEKTKHKTYFVPVSENKFFTYSTINTVDKYAARIYTAKGYVAHLEKLENATNDINSIHEGFELIPITCMISIMYILTRIRSIKRGVLYIPQNLFKRKNND